MKRGKLLTGIILSLLLIAAACLFVNSRTHAEEGSSTPDLSILVSRLDQILSNQRTIMDQVASMRQELNVIKIRVTQSQ